jgi:hypothetical protein
MRRKKVQHAGREIVYGGNSIEFSKFRCASGRTVSRGILYSQATRRGAADLGTGDDGL